MRDKLPFKPDVWPLQIRTLKSTQISSKVENLYYFHKILRQIFLVAQLVQNLQKGLSKYIALVFQQHSASSAYVVKQQTLHNVGVPIVYVQVPISSYNLPTSLQNFFLLWSVK